MATTRIIPMHVNKGKTILQCLTARIDYAKNPDKTENGELISSFACDPKTADAEFAMSKREYKTITGRTQQSDVIAYQFRQSFRPGEVTPEEANRIGYEFAERFLKGNHAFIVATHTDKQHIHNHIIWNSTTLNCDRKFRDFHRSGMAARRLSDLICIEHNLSVISHPGKKGLSYDRWLGDNAKPSFRDQLRAAIDAALQQKPISFDALLQCLRDEGYEIKPGKRISFRGKGQKRFIRLDKLGKGYSKDELIEAIAGKREHIPQKKKPLERQKVSLLVDIQAKLQSGKGAGYARWASVFNIKQIAQSIKYLDDHDIDDISDLAQSAQDAVQRFNTLSSQIKAKEQRMTELSALRTHVIAYHRTRETYAAYRKSGYSKEFRKEHEADILLHKAAKKAFDELGIQKLPKIASIQEEYTQLASEKKQLYADYRQARQAMRELLIVQENIEQILKEDDQERQAAENEKSR